MAKKSLGRKQTWSWKQLSFLNKLQQQNKNDWKKISYIFNDNFPNNNKTPKQCRQKYQSYQGSVCHKQTTKKFDQRSISLILKQIQKVGLSWTKIKQNLFSDNFFRKLGSNTIKNYYYASMKMYICRVNKIIKGMQLPLDQIQDKDLSYLITNTFLQYFQKFNTCKSYSYEDNLRLCLEIIEKSLFRQIQISLSEVYEIYNAIKYSKQPIQKHKSININSNQLRWNDEFKLSKQKNDIIINKEIEDNKELLPNNECVFQQNESIIHSEKQIWEIGQGIISFSFQIQNSFDIPKKSEQI